MKSLLALMLVPLTVAACGADDPNTLGGGDDDDDKAPESEREPAADEGTSSKRLTSTTEPGAEPGTAPVGPLRELAASPKKGVATFYDATGGGSCSFDKTPNDLDVAALAFPEYAESAACGTCIRVQGPKATVVVRVVDRCPGCLDKGVNLDLSASTFAKIAEPIQGRIPITYQSVACPTAGNVAYHYKEGSSKFWTAIQIRNHKLPIAKLEYSKAGAWVEIPRLYYNYFVAKPGVGDQPSGLKLRVTAADGQTIEDTLPAVIEPNKTHTGTHQFE